MKFKGNYIAPLQLGCYYFLHNEEAELSVAPPLKKFQLTAGPPQPDGAPRPAGFPSFTLWAFPCLDRENMDGSSGVFTIDHAAAIFSQTDARP